ncbi:unnamed protein product, partial [Allacma fusca]
LFVIAPEDSPVYILPPVAPYQGILNTINSDHAQTLISSPTSRGGED